MHSLQPFAISQSDWSLTYTPCRCLRGHKPGCYRGCGTGLKLQEDNRLQRTGAEQYNSVWGQTPNVEYQK